MAMPTPPLGEALALHGSPSTRGRGRGAGSAHGQAAAVTKCHSPTRRLRPAEARRLRRGNARPRSRRLSLPEGFSADRPVVLGGQSSALASGSSCGAGRAGAGCPQSSRRWRPGCVFRAWCPERARQRLWGAWSRLGQLCLCRAWPHGKPPCPCAHQEGWHPPPAVGERSPHPTALSALTPGAWHGPGSRPEGGFVPVSPGRQRHVMGSRGRWEGPGESLGGLSPWNVGPVPPHTHTSRKCPDCVCSSQQLTQPCGSRRGSHSVGPRFNLGNCPSLPHGVLGLSPQGGQDSNQADHSEPGQLGSLLARLEGSRPSPGRGLVCDNGMCSVGQPRLLAGTGQSNAGGTLGGPVVTTVWKEPGQAWGPSWAGGRLAFGPCSLAAAGHSPSLPAPRQPGPGQLVLVTRRLSTQARCLWRVCPRPALPARAC